MATYSGTLTSTGGSSKAIRLDKDLFRQHPEFETKKYRVSVIAPGKLLLSITEDLPESEEDPVVDAFLAFLSNDMVQNPQRIKPLNSAKLDEAALLIKRVSISDDEILSDDVSL